MKTQVKQVVRRATMLFAVSCMLLTPILYAQASGGSDWKSVEEAMGRPGQAQPGDVMRFAMPRKDLHVVLKGVEIKPGLALGSWAAFNRHGSEAMVMGDLVLTEDEVEPVMVLQEGGIQESALHNHLLGESPRVMYMHIASHGDAVQMAKAIHEALALTKTLAPDASATAQTASDLGFDQRQIEQALGHTGKLNGGILLQFAVPRAERITDSRHDSPTFHGCRHVLNFQPTGNGKAAITGDFVLLGSEVNPVIKSLGQNGIAVTALHSHMLMEEPRLFFMHFWANDDAVKLANALRMALDQTKSAK